MSFTLPNGAADGTVIPYYCMVHLGTMNTPNATITVSASAQPGPARARRALYTKGLVVTNGLVVAGHTPTHWFTW